MADDLPHGVKLAEGAAISEFNPINGNVGSFEPQLAGIQTQVQHSTNSGKPATDKPGLVGLGLVLTPDGPMVSLQLKHADGTALGAMMTIPDFHAHCEIAAETWGNIAKALGPTQGRG